jgi:hypothetical protein
VISDQAGLAQLQINHAGAIPPVPVRQRLDAGPQRRIVIGT